MEKLINLGYTLTKHKSVYFKKLLAVYVLYIIIFSDRRIKAYEQNKKTISYNECSKELTQLKKEKKVAQRTR